MPIKRVKDKFPELAEASDRVRLRVMALYKEGSYGRPGRLPSDWPSKAAREAMVDALTRVEGELEVMGSRVAGERNMLIKIRREIEGSVRGVEARRRVFRGDPRGG